MIVEGIHLLVAPELAGLFDVSAYIHADEALRLGRRIVRDVRNRGRTRSDGAILHPRSRNARSPRRTAQRALADLVIICPYEAGPDHADASAAQIADRLK